MEGGRKGERVAGKGRGKKEGGTEKACYPIWKPVLISAYPMSYFSFFQNRAILILVHEKTGFTKRDFIV